MDDPPSSPIRGPEDCRRADLHRRRPVAFYTARELPMGTPLRMGPAYFPAVLGCLLICSAALAGPLRACARGDGDPKFAWRGWCSSPPRPLVFGFIVRRSGFLAALPLLVVITAFASSQYTLWPRWRWPPASPSSARWCSSYGLGLPFRRRPWLGG